MHIYIKYDRMKIGGVIIYQKKKELTVAPWHNCYMQAGMSIA